MDDRKEVPQQETYDTVVNALRKQGKRSFGKADKVGHQGEINQVPGCLYRSPEGLRCAAGQLIPADKYRPNFEHQIVLSLSPKASVNEMNSVTRRIYELGHNLELVSELQFAHDLAGKDVFLPGSWEKRFWGIAQSRQLKYTPPKADDYPRTDREAVVKLIEEYTARANSI